MESGSRFSAVWMSRSTRVAEALTETGDNIQTQAIAVARAAIVAHPRRFASAKLCAPHGPVSFTRHRRRNREFRVSRPTRPRGFLAPRSIHCRRPAARTNHSLANEADIRAGGNSHLRFFIRSYPPHTGPIPHHELVTRRLAVGGASNLTLQRLRQMKSPEFRGGRRHFPRKPGAGMLHCGKREITDSVCRHPQHTARQTT